MKKFYAILLVALMSFSAAMAVDYSSTALSTSGAGSQKDYTAVAGGLDDLSYDEEDGQYCIYVICPLKLTPDEKTIVDLGWINPDGSRMLPNETMSWTISGGNGWFFETWLTNDQYSNESNNVYFVGAHWTYQEQGEVEASLDADDANTKTHITGLQLSGTPEKPACTGCSDVLMNCAGKGQFTFYPTQVVANEIAASQKYTWDVMIAVDYLTWVTPVDPDGTAYTTPVVAP